MSVVKKWWSAGAIAAIATVFALLWLPLNVVYVDRCSTDHCPVWLVDWYMGSRLPSVGATFSVKYGWLCGELRHDEASGSTTYWARGCIDGDGVTRL